MNLKYIDCARALVPLFFKQASAEDDPLPCTNKLCLRLCFLYPRIPRRIPRDPAPREPVYISGSLSFGSFVFSKIKNQRTICGHSWTTLSSGLLRQSACSWMNPKRFYVKEKYNVCGWTSLAIKDVAYLKSVDGPLRFMLCLFNIFFSTFVVLLHVIAVLGAPISCMPFFLLLYAFSFATFWKNSNILSL
jgi:hypothetical protein